MRVHAVDAVGAGGTSETTHATGRFPAPPSVTYSAPKTGADAGVIPTTATASKLRARDMRRATWNRFLLGLPLSLITAGCLFLGWQWLESEPVPWLQEKGNREIAMVAVVCLAWATTERLEKILRSFLGDRHFDC